MSSSGQNVGLVLIGPLGIVSDVPAALAEPLGHPLGRSPRQQPLASRDAAMLDNHLATWTFLQGPLVSA